MDRKKYIVFLFASSFLLCNSSFSQTWGRLGNGTNCCVFAIKEFNGNLYIARKEIKRAKFHWFWWNEVRSRTSVSAKVSVRSANPYFRSTKPYFWVWSRTCLSTNSYLGKCEAVLPKCEAVLPKYEAVPLCMKSYLPKCEAVLRQVRSRTCEVNRFTNLLRKFAWQDTRIASAVIRFGSKARWIGKFLQKF